MSISFLATLAGMCKAPAVDNSEAVAQKKSVELFKQAIDTGYKQYIEQMDDVLVSCGFMIEINEKGVATAVKKDVKATGAQPLMTVNGITSLMDLPIEASDVTMPLVDEYDAEEYASRYVSLDIRPECEDGSGIAFLRIINAKTRETVFPNFDPNDMPGTGLTPNARHAAGRTRQHLSALYRRRTIQWLPLWISER